MGEGVWGGGGGGEGTAGAAPGQDLKILILLLLTHLAKVLLYFTLPLLLSSPLLPSSPPSSLYLLSPSFSFSSLSPPVFFRVER